MMKVLAISASPRKDGNSDVLCDQFLKGAAETGHEVEKINLSGKKIAPCTACYGCGNTKTCVQKDDMADILQKLIEADVIVLATPVYFYSMCAQMKTMIDRCLPRYQEIQNKQFYFIITAADPQHSAAEETIAGLRGYLRCLPGAQEKGIVYGTGTWDKGDVYRHPSLERAYEMGKGV
jgi:multimeric flavodoxin WrbA